MRIDVAFLAPAPTLTAHPSLSDMIKDTCVQAPAAAPAAPTPDVLNILVGTITSVKRHPDAEKLYLQEIDVGEVAPRQVISGVMATTTTTL